MIDTQSIMELLYQVPRPPEDSIPGGVSAVEIDQFEARSGITLPTTFRQWLTLTNGPCVGPGGFYGIHPARSHLDIESCLRQFPDWRIRKWIPVAGDGCGNHYIIPTLGEFGPGFPVLFVDIGITNVLPSYVVASDLEHFILAILRKELEVTGWPFNRNYVLEFDPQIANVRGSALPWQ